ncbi:MAG: hypothetical protein ACRD0P_18580 [Stackebrandtia sp.]
MGILIAVVVVVVIGLIGLLVYFGFRNHKRVMGVLAEQPGWAAAHGFTYHAGFLKLPDASIEAPFSGTGINGGYFEGAHRGHRARAYVHTFEGHKDGSYRTIRYAVAAVPNDRPGLFLDLAPRGSGKRHGEPTALGDAEFDNRFALRTNDFQYARWLLRPEALAWIRQEPRFEQMPVRFDRGWILTWYEDHLNPKVLPTQFEFLTEIATRLIGR